MIRTCDGRDPNLLDEAGRAAGPCTCGLTFDDVERSVIWPHAFLMTDADKAALSAAMDTIVIDGDGPPDFAPALAVLATRIPRFARAGG